MLYMHTCCGRTPKQKDTPHTHTAGEMAGAAAGRVQRRVEILKASSGISYPVGASLFDFASVYGDQKCAMLPTPPEEAAKE